MPVPDFLASQQSLPPFSRLKNRGLAQPYSTTTKDAPAVALSRLGDGGPAHFVGTIPIEAPSLAAPGMLPR